MAAEHAEEFSAGGLVVRDGKVLVIVPTRRSATGERVLALPKGHPNPGESALAAAAREVREETGIEVEPIEQLGEVRYWYQRKGRRIAKRVAFFLFAPNGGSLEDHDDEVEEVRWMALEQAQRELSYSGEREMVVRAIARTRDSA
jgi:8-oxo-dGTP pyrophosphatase MutT (NUDIX family)